MTDSARYAGSGEAKRCADATTAKHCRPITRTYRTTTIGILHAEPCTDWEYTVEHSGSESIYDLITWGRTRITYGSDYPIINVDMVVVGHTVVEKPTLLTNMLYIDTGAHRTDNMTVLSLEECLKYIEQ